MDRRYILLLALLLALARCTGNGAADLQFLECAPGVLGSAKPLLDVMSATYDLGDASLMCAAQPSWETQARELRARLDGCTQPADGNLRSAHLSFRSALRLLAEELQAVGQFCRTGDLGRLERAAALGDQMSLSMKAANEDLDKYNASQQ